jgi:hypothetical protein
MNPLHFFLLWGALCWLVWSLPIWKYFLVLAVVFALMWIVR